MPKTKKIKKGNKRNIRIQYVTAPAVVSLDRKDGRFACTVVFDRSLPASTELTLDVVKGSGIAINDVIRSLGTITAGKDDEYLTIGLDAEKVARGIRLRVSITSDSTSVRHSRKFGIVDKAPPSVS